MLRDKTISSSQSEATAAYAQTRNPRPSSTRASVARRIPGVTAACDEVASPRDVPVQIVIPRPPGDASRGDGDGSGP